MKLKNYTDIDSGKIREVISATVPSGVHKFDVTIKNTELRGCAGMSYANGCSLHATADPFITVRLARTDALARIRFKEGKGYLGVVVGSRMEGLVFVIAHELRHLWQAKVKKGWRVWGAKGQFSERDADAYALQMLRKYRRGEILKGVN